MSHCLCKSTLSRKKQVIIKSHMTLHIFLFINNYSVVLIYLQFCLTVKSFFTLALLTSGLKDKEDKVTAVTVRFN